MTFHEMCKAVINECPEAYAKAYANAGLLFGDEDVEAQLDQALYIMGNITYWRGPTAKIIRAELKDFINKKQGELDARHS
jgi:hypothetical protein